MGLEFALGFWAGVFWFMAALFGGMAIIFAFVLPVVLLWAKYHETIEGWFRCDL